MEMSVWKKVLPDTDLDEGYTPLYILVAVMQQSSDGDGNATVT
jgi:hypothetical protein